MPAPSTLLFIFAGLLSVATAADWLIVPGGHRRAECVHGVSNNAHVEAHPDGSSAILVTTPEGASSRHEVAAICHTAESWRHPDAGQAKQRIIGSPPSCNVSPCTCDALPCNNWIDNAGYFEMTKGIGAMNAQYVTPGTPRTPNNNQTLFYFIGAENTDGLPRHGNPPPSGRAILQPVLTFDPSGWGVKTPQRGGASPPGTAAPRTSRSTRRTFRMFARVTSGTRLLS